MRPRDLSGEPLCIGSFHEPGIGNFTAWAGMAGGPVWIVHRGQEIVLRSGDRIEWDIASLVDAGTSPCSARVLHGDGSAKWLVRAVIEEEETREKLVQILKDVATAAGVPLARGVSSE